MTTNTQDPRGQGADAGASTTASINASTTASTTGSTTADGSAKASAEGHSARRSQWPLWEVFVRSKAGLDHKHCGSLHAVDGAMALQLARDVYTRRQEGTSVWVVRSDQIIASDPRDKSMLFDPADDKIYRHPTFYELPDSLNHM
jgi:ring-1,2-phenylacetyl-CoA epoxidase subunit PaaB